MVQVQSLPFVGDVGGTYSLKESFLHYVWQFQYFNSSGLSTEDGEPVAVFATGFHNTHAGPDFVQARVKIGGMQWVGCVELHVYGSDWDAHRHAEDAAYENVILHVVWENDKPGASCRQLVDSYGGAAQPHSFGVGVAL